MKQSCGHHSFGAAIMVILRELRLAFSWNSLEKQKLPIPADAVTCLAPWCDDREREREETQRADPGRAILHTLDDDVIVTAHRAASNSRPTKDDASCLRGAPIASTTPRH